MKRRTFLATGVTALGSATAGCSNVPGGEISLTDPTVGIRDGGRAKYLTYRHDDRRIMTVGFDQQTVPTSLTEQFRFGISVPHSDDTKIESFRFDLRAPRSSIDPPADVYLEAPGGGLWPDLTYEVVENGWTRIALDDTDELGEGTMNLETIVNPRSVPAEEVAVRVEMALSSSGSPPNRTYRIDASTEFEPVIG